VQCLDIGIELIFLEILWGCVEEDFNLGNSSVYFFENPVSPPDSMLLDALNVINEGLGVRVLGC